MLTRLVVSRFMQGSSLSMSKLPRDFEFSPAIFDIIVTDIVLAFTWPLWLFSYVVGLIWFYRQDEEDRREVQEAIGDVSVSCSQVSCIALVICCISVSHGLV